MMADALPWENIRAFRVLTLLKEAVGLWHWRHPEMMGILSREHPVKIQGLSPSLLFAPSIAHLASSLSLSISQRGHGRKVSMMPPGTEKNHPSVHLHLCVCVSGCMIDLICTRSLCVCVFVKLKIMYRRVGGWPHSGLCRTLSGLSDRLQPGRCAGLMWCDEHFASPPVVSSLREISNISTESLWDLLQGVQ